MFRSCLRAAALAVAIPVAAQAQLVNGSFEGCGAGNYIGSAGDNAIAGWTMSQQGVEWFRAADFGVVAHGGSCAIDLSWYTSNGTPGGGIKQSFATVVGQTYLLSYWGTTSRSSGRDGTGLIEIWLNGSLYGSNSVTNLNATFGLSDWVQFTHTFTATGATTDLEFRNQQNAFLHFTDVDDVSVSAVSSTVPEPASVVLLASGLLGLLITGRSRRSR